MKSFQGKRVASAHRRVLKAKDAWTALAVSVLKREAGALSGYAVLTISAHEA